jgi:alkylation response protein AidB-like acyl-CoA dehydrogenase
MTSYTAPLRDYRFVLEEVLDIGRLAALPGYEEATPDVFAAVLEAGGKFCEEVLLPLNQSGDREGCAYENGAVRTPAGFKDAYRRYREDGWTAVDGDPAFGGQGLPHALYYCFAELLFSTNLSFGMYPGLSGGAYRAIRAHGSVDQQARYLPRLVDGTWSGTMCLTEPQCGSDLGLIRTRAAPTDDGAYRITGTKIFISAGEHDLTENIVHLVLARLPDAPPGIRGISLFLVPKFLVGDDGMAGGRNTVRCGSIEHKMGLNGSATCVMNFDDAVGTLVGEPHSGMHQMFTMMNVSRLGVALQGLGLGEIAYQNAVAYARERLQGRALTGAKAPDKPADPIIVHPELRRLLLTMKANTEAARALAGWVGINIDIAERHPDAGEREAADDLVALLTPVLKSYLTDAGFAAANLALQAYGGHGYIRDNGVEQFVRDARITQIYEGTNAIQALDLIGRKLPMHDGRLLKRLLQPIGAFIQANQAVAEMREFLAPLGKALGELQQATGLVAQRGRQNPDEAAAIAGEYLKLLALTALAFMWARMAKVALGKLGGDEPEFYQAKLATARFFMARILPETVSLLAVINAGAAPLMELDAAAF